VSLRLLSYNIRYGGTGREKLLASVINSCAPDLVILQEAGDPEVVRQLAAACGMKSWGANRGDSLGFLSRIEIARYAWHNVLLGKRRYLEILPVRSNIRVFGLHLSAIHSNPTEWRRTFELRSLLSQIADYREAFHLVTGDFNTLAPGEELDVRRLPPRLRALLWMGGGRVRWRTIRLMIEAGYSDAYRFLHPGDPGHTFPTWDPNIRLDYLFTPAAFQSRITGCEVIRNAPEAGTASDHFPLLSEVTE
jgi:exodeoxyribonuclease-3